MAYYYYYQQNQTPPSPVTTAAELNPPTPLLMLPQHQQQLNLPLLTPILPSVNTSMPMTSTAVTTEQNQQQLPTPNTFIRHCDDIGLFHDLQNIVVMPSLPGSSSDTLTTSIPNTTTATMATTSTSTGEPLSSNLFGPSSNAIVTTMMMANPFDETFKQAVLQQQNTDTNPSGNIFNKNNNTDGDLNTPFITTTTAVDTFNNNDDSGNNDSDVIMETSVDTISTTEAISTTVNTLTTTSASMPQQQQQNVFITTPAAEATPGTVLVMMVEQQQRQPPNSVVSIQPQHNQIVEQPFIIPTTTTTDINDTRTMTSHHQNYYENEGDDENGVMAQNIENETTTIKQTLKQNLLEKQLLQGRPRQPFFSEVSERYNDLGLLQQINNNINDIASNVSSHEIEICNNIIQDDEDDDLKQKLKQELLERNRWAAKRCRMKRKERWDLISEENRRLKLENGKLRDAVAKLVNNRSCSCLKQKLQQHSNNQNASKNDKDV